MVEALSSEFNVDVMHISEENLRRAQDACPSSSALAEAATGLRSVAEAAALAAAGPASRLILPRIKSVYATCALATRVAENEEVSP